MMLNVLVVGAGAIGCFIGGRLAATNHRVTLVGRRGLMEKIAADGVTLRSPYQPDQQSFPATTTSIPSLDPQYDFILVTVKSPDTVKVIDQLATLSLPLDSTHIVSLQNGVGNEEALASSFGPGRVIAGTVTIPINMPQPGLIEVSKDKGGLGLASLEPTQPVQTLAGCLERADFAVGIYEDYRSMKWSKLLLNIVNNATSAILNLTPAEIVDQPSLLDLEFVWTEFLFL